MRISDWSSDVCSSDLLGARAAIDRPPEHPRSPPARDIMRGGEIARARMLIGGAAVELGDQRGRSEEHTSELQSLMRISYAVFCLKKKTNKQDNKTCVHRRLIHDIITLQR